MGRDCSVPRGDEPRAPEEVIAAVDEVDGRVDSLRETGSNGRLEIFAVVDDGARAELAQIVGVPR
jgi:hypothetical protein